MLHNSTLSAGERREGEAKDNEWKKCLRIDKKMKKNRENESLHKAGKFIFARGWTVALCDTTRETSREMRQIGGSKTEKESTFSESARMCLDYIKHLPFPWPASEPTSLSSATGTEKKNTKITQ